MDIYQVMAALGAVVCVAIVVSALITGKTLNMVMRGGPILAARSDRPRVFWISNVAILVTGVVNVCFALRVFDLGR